MKADWKAQSARPREMSLANLLREAKGGACPPFLRSYKSLAPGIIEFPRIVGWILPSFTESDPRSAQATGADVTLQRLPAKENALFLKVNAPPLFCAVMRVAQSIEGLRTTVTDNTESRHDFLPDKGD